MAIYHTGFVRAVMKTAWQRPAPAGDHWQVGALLGRESPRCARRQLASRFPDELIEDLVISSGTSPATARFAFDGIAIDDARGAR